MRIKITKQQDIEIKKMYLKGITSDQIASKYNLVYPQPILNSLKRSGVQRRKEWKRASGEKNGQWKGGKKMIKGYIHILNPLHHLARKSDGYVPFHRMVAEGKIGRRLLPKEVVNHIDGNPINNNPDNLNVFKNNGEHIKNHINKKDFKRNKKGIFIKNYE